MKTAYKTNILTNMEEFVGKTIKKILHDGCNLTFLFEDDSVAELTIVPVFRDYDEIDLETVIEKRRLDEIKNH